MKGCPVSQGEIYTATVCSSVLRGKWALENEGSVRACDSGIVRAWLGLREVRSAFASSEEPLAITNLLLPTSAQAT